MKFSYKDWWHLVLTMEWFDQVTQSWLCAGRTKGGDVHPALAWPDGLCTLAISGLYEPAGGRITNCRYSDAWLLIGAVVRATGPGQPVGLQWYRLKVLQWSLEPGNHNSKPIMTSETSGTKAPDSQGTLDTLTPHLKPCIALFWHGTEGLVVQKTPVLQKQESWSPVLSGPAEARHLKIGPLWSQKKPGTWSLSVLCFYTS